MKNYIWHVLFLSISLFSLLYRIELYAAMFFLNSQNLKCRIRIRCFTSCLKTIRIINFLSFAISSLHFLSKTIPDWHSFSSKKSVCVLFSNSYGWHVCLKRKKNVLFLQPKQTMNSHFLIRLIWYIVVYFKTLFQIERLAFILQGP